ncbi:hypothetical protein ACFVX3_31145 [Rhodococcus erythropolis]
MEWFVSVWDEEADIHQYRGGQAFDHASAIEHVVAAGRVVARRDDGSLVGNAGNVVIDGTPVNAIPFGDLDISDEQLRRLIAATFDRVRRYADPTRGHARPTSSPPPHSTPGPGISPRSRHSPATPEPPNPDTHGQ